MFIQVRRENFEFLVEIPKKESEVVLDFFVVDLIWINGIRERLGHNDVDAPVHLFI